jgi:hypothetical protein
MVVAGAAGTSRVGPGEDEGIASQGPSGVEGDVDVISADEERWLMSGR